jgi:diguanylate cyclase (GGDEF)-like protein/PAS domain S-box-containing protein
MSFLVIGAVGGGFTLFLALKGQDRALSLVPIWILFVIWIFGAAMVLTGRLSGDIVVSALVAGLVLILVLIGFTVTQFAFRSLEPLYGAAPSELQLRALAVDGAGSAVWEWNARRDEIKVSPVVEAALGLSAGELSTKVEDFVKHLHPADRDRFRLMLWTMQERTWAKMRTDFRMRHADNSYRWFELEAASVPNADARALRCVGLMRDVTDAKRAHERLLHDAVHDSLTGLPNRELMLDRLGVAVMRAKSKEGPRPCVFFIDIDKFKSVNVSFGLVVGDSLLLTIARRLQSHLGPQDTLARVGGDQFAMLLVGEQGPQELASLAERIRRSLRAPIKFAVQEFVLTGSLGLAVYDGGEGGHLDLYKEAEIAMYRAKRAGADRIEIFRPEMRADRDDRITLESDLRKALTKNQIRVLYQPIVYLPTEELAGFEALMRWEHPKRGLMSPADFVPLAEESDLIVRLGSHVLLRAAHEAARWQRELPREEDPLFVSVNISSRQIFRQNLIQEIRHILGRNIVPKGSLRLEITESLVMENPEQAAEILEWLRGAGAELALDDFGTGYSSLAYLQRFPFDTIKIDRALVQSSGANTGAGSAIVRSIVALGHELGKKVVAEGVESPEDVGFLRSIGCQYAQGFYYGEPMSDRDVLQLLKMVRTAEHKLRPRGFFRAKSKGKKDKVRKKPAALVAARANGNGGEASASPPAIPSAALPNSTLRQRSRPAQIQQPMPPPSPSPFPPPEFTGLPPPSPLVGQPPLVDMDQSQSVDAPLPLAGFPLPPLPPPPLSPAPPLPPLGMPVPDSAKSSELPPLENLQAALSNPIVLPSIELPPTPPPLPMASAPPPPAAAVPNGSAEAPPLDVDSMAAALRKIPAPQPAPALSTSLAELTSSFSVPTAPPVSAAAPISASAPSSDPAASVAATQSPSSPTVTTTGRTRSQTKRPARRAMPRQPVPDFAGLPPAMAQSLARLAGVPWPPPDPQAGATADAAPDKAKSKEKNRRES